jgi:16S rRNA (adenine1518-N6/adenine1519-N6)-dimethyltransferase
MVLKEKRNSKPHKARKRFGQNFLQDQSVIDDIIEAISPQAEQHIVEIGPGQAALTRPLLQSCNHVDVIEIDRDLIPILQDKLAQFEHLTIHEADALKYDYTKLVQANEKLRVIGNLPYNITTPLLFHLVEQSAYIDDMCFMLQREVVERICAQPGTKHYGRLSIMLQHQCDVEMLFIVAAEAFDPVPKVESAIIYLKPLTDRRGGQVNLKTLNKVVTAAFSQRRKTIANTLKSITSLSTLEAVGIDAKSRPEQVNVEQFVALAKVIELE